MRDKDILEDINSLVYQEEFNFSSYDLKGKIVKGLSGLTFISSSVLTTLVLFSKIWSDKVIESGRGAFGIFKIIENTTKIPEERKIELVNKHFSEDFHSMDEAREFMGTFFDSNGDIIPMIPAAVVITLFALSGAAFAVFLSQVPKDFKPIFKKINSYDKKTKKEVRKMLKDLDKEYRCKKDQKCLVKMFQEFKKRIKNSDIENKEMVINDINKFEKMFEKKVQ